MELLKQGQLLSLKTPSVIPTLENIKADESKYLEFKKEIEAYLNMEQNAIGIALPQFGEHTAAFGMKFKDNIEVCFAPRILASSKVTSIFMEGCMSFPGVKCLVERPVSIDVSYFVYERNQWKHIKTKLSDNQQTGAIYAKVFQHEFDHTKGITMLERALPIAPTDRIKLMKIDSDFCEKDYYIEGEEVLIYENKKINPQDYPDFINVGIYDK